MNEQEYNGWSNRETWATMLHIDNDEGLLEIALDFARQELEGHDKDEEINAYYLGNQLSEWVQEDLLTRENVGANNGLWLMLTDIGSLYRVNWQEIAETLIAYAREQEAVNA
jgi:hypothetical protein